MGFLDKLLQNFKDKKERKNIIVAYGMQLDQALNEINIVFSKKDDFIDPVMGEEWKKRYYTIINANPTLSNFLYKRTSGYKEMDAKYVTLLRTCDEIRGRISQHNESVATLKIDNARKVLGNVEGRQLDRQQMACVLKDVYNHLVIAGAGTGKTTTIVGKIKYLLKTGQYKPEEILVLSFTNASASEMRERIHKETGYPIDASTFHKLGLNIVTAVNGVRPNITQLQMKKFVKEELQRNMQSKSYLLLLASYLLFHRVEAKSEFDFETKAEYEEYLRLNAPVTMKKESVKSYGEMEIANFLAQNGVRYCYEHPYEFDTRTEEYSQYNPDFYLPDYNIYIEYFGINRQGEVPSYFNGSHGMSATQAYRKSMDWKRELHRANNTLMIECFAYEKMEGTLLDNLKAKLEENGVVLQPMTAEELWQQLEQEGTKVLDGVVNLFETLINLIKSNNYTISSLRNMCIEKANTPANHMILSLIEPIFDAYCKYLVDHDEIDFNDMIYQAMIYVRGGKYHNPYRYVIVDEYQDISKSRFLLLDSLRQSTYFKLFCVGDDWQSIYRFAGSDVEYILEFEKYWGPTEVSKIETTYRFGQELAEISSQFVMKNSRQIRKSIRGLGEELGFPLGVISGYQDKFAVRFMLEKLDSLPEKSSVFFIGRYTFDIDILKESNELQYSYDNINKKHLIHYSKRRDLDMSFITAHGSKGLQADYVFIINNKNTRMGFPSKIQDAAILQLLLEGHETYPFAEERRLFYVALTRAKKKAYLLTVNGIESDFAVELKSRYEREIKKEQWTCPLCGRRIVKRTGKNGEFFGCSNYREKGCRYTRNITGEGRYKN